SIVGGELLRRSWATLQTNIPCAWDLSFLSFVSSSSPSMASPGQSSTSLIQPPVRRDRNDQIVFNHSKTWRGRVYPGHSFASEFSKFHGPHCVGRPAKC